MAEDGPSVKLHVESYCNANWTTEKPVKEVHWLYEWQKGEGLDAVVDHIRRAEHAEVHREGIEIDDGRTRTMPAVVRRCSGYDIMVIKDI